MLCLHSAVLLALVAPLTHALVTPDLTPRSGTTLPPLSSPIPRPACILLTRVVRVPPPAGLVVGGELDGTPANLTHPMHARALAAGWTILLDATGEDEKGVVEFGDSELDDYPILQDNGDLSEHSHHLALRSAVRLPVLVC